MPTGIMPERFTLVPCYGEEDCVWRTEKWNDAVKSAGFGEYARELDAADIIKQDSLPPGFAKISDRRFLLRYVHPQPITSILADTCSTGRPEAIESLFVMYRITGDPTLADSAWRMFQSINNATMTKFAHSAIADVTTSKEQESQKLDECESFWMAETLKYFYLIFSEPELISLDEFVL
jgi:mannosyl-oligosaccharide alpha-1,2-mannosidase